MGRQGHVKGVRALELSLQLWPPTSFLCQVRQYSPIGQRHDIYLLRTCLVYSQGASGDPTNSIGF